MLFQTHYANINYIYAGINRWVPNYNSGKSFPAFIAN